MPRLSQSSLKTLCPPHVLSNVLGVLRTIGWVNAIIGIKYRGKSSVDYKVLVIFLKYREPQCMSASTSPRVNFIKLNIVFTDAADKKPEC